MRIFRFSIANMYYLQKLCGFRLLSGIRTIRNFLRNLFMSLHGVQFVLKRLSKPSQAKARIEFDPSNTQQQVFENNGCYILPIGDMGFDGIFIMHEDSEAKWRFVQPGTTSWDSLHQAIYLAKRYAQYDFKSIAHKLPEISELPDKSFGKWQENFESDDACALTHPYLVFKLTHTFWQTLTVFAILKEDLYEAHFGDGQFRYYKRVFVSCVEAKAFVTKSKTKHMDYHIVPLTLKFDNKKIVSPDFRPVWPEHYYLKDVLYDLENYFRETSKQVFPILVMKQVDRTGRTLKEACDNVTEELYVLNTTEIQFTVKAKAEFCVTVDDESGAYIRHGPKAVEHKLKPKEWVKVGDIQGWEWDSALLFDLVYKCNKFRTFSISYDLKGCRKENLDTPGLGQVLECAASNLKLRKWLW